MLETLGAISLLMLAAGKWWAAVAAFLATAVVYWPPRALLKWLADKSGGRILFSDQAPTFSDERCRGRGSDSGIDEKVVALTIDDGLSVETGRIAEVLERHGARATFFLLGSAIEKHDPDGQVLRGLAAGGHELANHGYVSWPAVAMTSKALRSQIVQTDRLISERISETTASQRQAKWYRPSHGLCGPGVLQIAGELGLRVALGSCYPHDPLIRSTWLNRQYIEARIRSGDVIILHDRPWTLPLLAELLPSLRRRGFRVTTLSELTNPQSAAKSAAPIELVGDCTEACRDRNANLNHARRLAVGL